MGESISGSYLPPNTHRNSLTQRHTLKHTHTDTHTHTQTNSRTQTQTHRDWLTNTHRERHSHIQRNTHSNTVTQRQTLTQTHTHTDSHTQTHSEKPTHSHTASHTHRLTQSDTQSETHKDSQWYSKSISAYMWRGKCIMLLGFWYFESEELKWNILEFTPFNVLSKIWLFFIHPKKGHSLLSQIVGLCYQSPFFLEKKGGPNRTSRGFQQFRKAELSVGSFLYFSPTQFYKNIEAQIWS